VSFEPRGHKSVVEGLWSSARDGRLAHALLFKGPEGVGKFRSARWLAQGLMCAEGPGVPCDQCGSCRRAAIDSHPDIFLVDAPAVGHDLISVHFIAERIRPPSAYQGQSVEDFLRLRAHEGGWRIVIVREADRMNVSAQNAFLKTLEEPSAQTLIVLETSEPGRLLTTINSRVVTVEFGGLEREDASAILASNGVDPVDANVLARWSRGAPGHALRLQRTAALEMRPVLVDVLLGHTSPPGAATVLWDIDGEFRGKKPSAKLRDRVRAILDLGLELLGDGLRAASGAPLESLAHGDVAADFAARGAVLARWRMEEWLRARQDVQANMGADAILDRALYALAAQALRPPVGTH